MRVVLFCHSLLSDWNHGNAHFLRGVVTELAARGHEVRVFEPRDAWSVQNLVADHGEAALDAARLAFPAVDPVRYDLARLDLAAALDGADLVIVHEWNDPDLCRRIGARRTAGARFRLLFHDTHHRSATDPAAMARYDLSGYDGVLAFGGSVCDRYLRNGWARHVFVWHEAADTRVFHPRPSARNARDLDLVWIGNWGDDERGEELEELLVAPVRDLGLRAVVYGVRYPAHALAALSRAGIAYEGWLPNHRVPEVFARARVTVHVPRRPYAAALPGIPTIRPFEALACGIPLVSGPWDDREHLFSPGEDYLVAADRAEMTRCLRALRESPDRAHAMAERGRSTILARHTCAHRVEELLAITRSIDSEER